MSDKNASFQCIFEALPKFILVLLIRHVCLRTHNNASCTFLLTVHTERFRLFGSFFPNCNVKDLCLLGMLLGFPKVGWAGKSYILV